MLRFRKAAIAAAAVLVYNDATEGAGGGRSGGGSSGGYSAVMQVAVAIMAAGEGAEPRRLRLLGVVQF
jgi:hypothetical protein